MSLTKHEWNLAVLLGCLVGTGIVLLFWAITLALAELNRGLPGAGWVAAGVLTLCVGLSLWHELRWLNRPHRTTNHQTDM